MTRQMLLNLLLRPNWALSGNIKRRPYSLYHPSLNMCSKILRLTTEAVTTALATPP